MDDWDTGPTNTDFESIPRHDQAIIDAAKNGDVAAVRQWLDDGGNADARIKVGPYIPGRDNYVFGGDDEGLLHHIATDHPNNSDDEVKRGRCDVARLLIARGAAVDAVGNWPPEFSPRDTPLFIATIFGHHDLCEVFCAAGADPNYTRLRFDRGVARCADFPLWKCLTSPATVRVLLRFGADPSRKCSSHFGGDLVTPEEEALRWVNSHYEPGDEADYRESASLLAAPRLLRPRRRGIFALRTLVLRGRASPTTETPAAFARLIVRGTSRPRTRAAAKTLPSPGLPDPLAHLVCKFWLGEPPRRRTE